MTSPATCARVLALLWILAAGVAIAEDVKIPTLTIANETFIRGGSDGKKQVVSGEPEWPTGATGPVPAVVLMHGGSGVMPYISGRASCEGSASPRWSSTASRVAGSRGSRTSWTR